jgi:hypothetical protein
VKPDLAERQAEMHARWNARNYQLPQIDDRKVIEKRKWHPVAIKTVKVTVRRFGTIPVSDVEELQQLGAFIAANISAGPRRLMEIMAECALAYTGNDVLREIFPIFLNAVKREEESKTP